MEKYNHTEHASISTNEYHVAGRSLDLVLDQYTKNLATINILKTFMGGDDENIPLHDNALSDMRFLVDACKDFNLPQPEIFPWAGGNGIQAEWEYDWYLEIDSSKKGISVLCIKGKDYDNAISIGMTNIETAFLLVKGFINNIVDVEGKRF